MGIVAVSLALSGLLTGILVRQLEFDNAQDQLARSAVAARSTIQRLECVAPQPNGACGSGGRVSQAQFIQNVRDRIGSLNLESGDRLLLLGRARAGVAVVVFDSEDRMPVGTPIDLGSTRRQVAGEDVQERTVTLNDTEYVVAGAQLGSAQPRAAPYASWLVLARPLNLIAVHVTSELAPRLLLAAAAALGLAVVVSFLLGRAVTRPLQELKSAAEDVAAGNYSRRVSATGRDEIGVVGQAFNRMAEAVGRTRSQQRTFLANVSHELKTPLTSLIGFSQALMDGSLRTDEEKTRAAAILHEEAERVLRMSQELLDLARVEAGQLTLSLHPVDLGVHLQQEIEIVRPRAQARDLVLRLSSPSSLQPVQADPDRLHQIIENLLDNAVKYALSGTEIGISAEAAPGGRVRTVVRNQVASPGPPPERMFDRFYRADLSRSSAGGVGLGLAISRELATAQGGSLTAALEGPNRLAVTLELPAVGGQPPASAPGRTPAWLQPRPQRG